MKDIPFSHSHHRIQIALFFFLWFGFSYFEITFAGWNVNTRLDLVYSIVERGTLSIDALSQWNPHRHLRQSLLPGTFLLRQIPRAFFHRRSTLLDYLESPRRKRNPSEFLFASTCLLGRRHTLYPSRLHGQPCRRPAWRSFLPHRTCLWSRRTRRHRPQHHSPLGNRSRRIRHSILRIPPIGLMHHGRLLLITLPYRLEE